MKRSDWENAKYKENGKTKETYINTQGFKMALPMYYRNKIYSEEEREKLWIEKLDKEERWVCGEKVSIKDNEYEEYNKKSIRHWLVTELGHKGTENIHLHGLIYTKDTAEIHKHWQYGYCYYGSYVNQRTVNYIVKYITKTDVQHRYYKPIVLCSKGIGSGYTKRAVSKDNQYKNEQTRDYYRTEQGYKLALPIYWRNKLYTDEQREQLWLNRLNEQARFVLGQKVSIAKNPFTYFKMVDEARKLNAQLGYGNNKIDWNRKNYEEQLRRIS